MERNGFLKVCRKFGGAGPHILQGGRKTFPCNLVAIAQLEERSFVKGMVGGSSPLSDPMSYRNKKNRKSKAYKLKFLVWLFFNKIKRGIRERKERKMGFLQVRRVMGFLRARNKIIRPNNQKISEWVDEYLGRCFVSGEPVNILTQWCLSKAFEKRFEEEGKGFVPTKKERKVLDQEIPQIIQVFLENGFRVNWWITFNRSYLKSRLLDGKIEEEYKRMVIELAKNPVFGENTLFFDWDKDVLGARPQPERSVLERFSDYVNPGRYEIELQRWLKWAEEEADLEQPTEELKKDVKYQIACEAQEGVFIMSPDFPLGRDFIVVPLEAPERFDNFTILNCDLKKRIVSVLSLYPWRRKLEQ